MAQVQRPLSFFTSALSSIWPRLSIILLTLAILGTGVRAQHQSVLIYDGGGACEPSIKIDPDHPQRMVAGAVLDHIFHSADSGMTWQHQRVSSPYGVWGDPVIDVDTAGTFYYFHLSNPEDGDWIDRIVCQRSSDGGASWDKGTFAGLNGVKEQDKHWSVIDPGTNAIHLTWTEFDDYGSKSDTCMSRIRYAQSSNGGESWSEAKSISTIPGDCLDDDDTVEGAVPAIGPNGELYVSWMGPSGLTFSKSLDNGKTWTTERQLDPVPGGWSFDIPGIYRANGLPVTKVDCSGGPNHGAIYINWTDQRNGAKDTDVWLVKSSDGGESWTPATRVNQDQGPAQQFFTWMEIDQRNGDLYFLYYDRRAERTEPLETEVYMSISTDGAQSFHDFPLLSGDSAYFKPNSAVFFGDYTNLSIESGLIRPIWTRMEDKKTSIWTAIVDPSRLSTTLYHVSADLASPPDKKLCLVLVPKAKKRGKKITELVLGRENTRVSKIISLQGIKPGEYQFRITSAKAVLWESEQFVIHDRTE